MCGEFVLCLVISGLTVYWVSSFGTNYDQFIPKQHPAVVEAILNFFTLFILITGLIPISLILSLEMVQLVHAYFINNDVDMYDPIENRFSKALSSSLTDELGQIEYIFTDKTGTLTRNILGFKYAMVAGRLLCGALPSAKESTSDTHSQSRLSSLPPLSLDLYRKDRSHFQEMFDAPAHFLLADKKGNPLVDLTSNMSILELFLTALSLCHDCILEQDKQNVSLFRYAGTSPDEIVLVTTAKDAGFIFLKNTNQGKVVQIRGTDIEFEVKCFFEFNSDRKRSSIILEWNGVIIHLVKGADSIVMARLREDIDSEGLGVLQRYLDGFSVQGLRTLCFGVKAYSAEEWADIKQCLDSFDGAADRPKLLDQLADNIERDFLLLGCTAVEDRLQDKVPTTIADFLSANIKVWMLTGDKMETAENIAFSCRLIQETFIKHYLFYNDNLEDKMKEIEGSLADKSRKVALVMEGSLIMRIMSDHALATKMAARVFSKAQAVVCFRMSPNDKGDVVSLIKDHQGKITLAVGDGANDVNMIKRAHIGVGLYGQEGLRAAQSGDFACVDFKALWKLLFVHGHWSYIRISDMVLYFFYKNTIFTMVQFFYAFDNGYSGQTIYDSYYITFFNLFFTSWPLLIRATFDQDLYYKKWTRSEDGNVKTLAENKLLKRFYPYLYYVGPQNMGFK
jgi:phospholipid-transporting ATPase